MLCEVIVGRVTLGVPFDLPLVCTLQNEIFTHGRGVHGFLLFESCLKSNSGYIRSQHCSSSKTFKREEGFVCFCCVFPEVLDMKFIALAHARQTLFYFNPQLVSFLRLDLLSPCSQW